MPNMHLIEMTTILFLLAAVIFREVASGHGDITEINYPSSKATANLGLFEANTPGLIPGKITNGKNIKDSKQDLESVSQGIRALCYMSTNCKPEFWTGTCQNGKKIAVTTVSRKKVDCILVLWSQSPINLDVRTSFNKRGYPLEFEEGYVTNKRSFFIANDGHSTLIQLQKGGTSNCSFTHSDLRLRYTFSQLHFHWGKFGDYGSEHTVQTQRFPIEMHLVHYKSSYESLDDALDSKDSTAVSVIAVFFKIASANKALEPILSRMKEASAKRSPEVTKVQGTVNLSKLLPTKKSFFRYKGSLTTATCAETVLWEVFDNPLEISNQQAKAFWSLVPSHGEQTEVSSYRTIQDLNGRIVEYFMN